MKKNYVLIDYENVQPAAMQVLNAEPFNIIVFVGADQAKVNYEVASSLQRMGDRASYVKIAGNGSNALDFHIAYYIGHLSTMDPDAFFHIVSKDTGFDPLVKHLRSRKIGVRRTASVTDIPSVKVTACKSDAERAADVVANLVQRGAAKPRTVKTLTSTIHALFQKSLTDADVEGVLHNLIEKGIVVVCENKVSYALPDNE